MRLLEAFEAKGKGMQDEVAAQIVALNKADLVFRLAEWHYKQAVTDIERRNYMQSSLFAASMRAQILNWLEEHHVAMTRKYGEYMQLTQV